MKNPLLSLILFHFIIAFSHAQHLQKKMYGVSWETSPIKSNSTQPVFPYKQRIEFSGPDRFELCEYFYVENPDKHDTLIYQGHYKYQPKEKKIYFDVTFVRRNTLQARFNRSFDYEFRELDDSTIYLFNTSLHKKSTAPYEKEHYYPDENNPEKVFYLVNVKDTTRKIDLDREHEMNMDELSADTSVSFINTGLMCYFDSIRGDSLFIRIQSEDIYTIYKNNSSTWKQNDYGHQYKTKKIAIDNINYIKVKPPFRKKMTKIATTIMIASIADIVLAPLLSYNLKTGDKNNTLQSNILIGGVAGLGISIPIAVLGRNKKAVISKSYRTRESNYWMLRERSASLLAHFK